VQPRKHFRYRDPALGQLRYRDTRSCGRFQRVAARLVGPIPFVSSRRRRSQGRDPGPAAAPQRPSAQVHRCRHPQCDRLPGEPEMTIRHLLLFAALPLLVRAQGLTQATLLKPPADSWPTYNGDYTGRRFSALKQIHTGNVHTLSLAWASRYSGGGTPNLTIK